MNFKYFQHHWNFRMFVCLDSKEEYWMFVYLWRIDEEDLLNRLIQNLLLRWNVTIEEESN